MKANNLDVLGGIADKLGQVKAQLADLKKQEAELKQDLIDSGLAVVEGAFYRVAISESDGKTITDWRAIAEKFSPSRQLIRANTSVGESYVTVRVSARKSS